jgi:predicted ATPase/DNA-binding CsgD family transcriptional regulator
MTGTRSSAGVLLPGPLWLAPSFPFVGRGDELASLRSLLPRAEGEGRRVALVTGEPGSGKSRLVRELAQAAAGEGVVVLYGACDSVVRMPYRPFVEALDQLMRQSDAAALALRLGATAAELARLIPDLGALLGATHTPPVADPDTERYRLHSAVTDLLVASGRQAPLLLALEDLHWADPPTLMLLRHLARSRGEARLLILATFRDPEAETVPELPDALADLRRSEDVVRLRLAGLTADEVREFVRRAAEGDLGAELPELASTISELTDGNPFLVCELWRMLLDTGSVVVESGTARLLVPATELGTPESVREVLGQRLSRLGDFTSEVLELAAIAGPEFELSVLERAATGEAEAVSSALEEAVASGMIAEVPGRRLTYRFTHELVRRALYDRLSALRRAEHHLRVAQALEVVRGATPGRGLADLAYHFTAAAPLGESSRAIRYNVLAAEAASATLAFEEAAARLETALELGISEKAEQGRVLLDLGTAHRRAGEWLDAREAFAAAAEIARALGDAEMLARSAIGFEEACWRPRIAEQEALGLLEEAAAALGGAETSVRVMVLAELACALADHGHHERSAATREEAIGLARRIDDRHGLATMLMRAYWARGTSTHQEVLDMLAEARELAEALVDVEVRAEAIAWRVPTFVALSDLASARTELVSLVEAAEQTRQPFMLYVAEQYGSAFALCDGRLAEAEERAERAYELSRMMAGRDASGVYGIQMFGVRREQGRLAELAPVLRLLAREGRESDGAWKPALAAALVELGMESEARRVLAHILADGLEPLRHSLWLASLTYLADAATVGGERVAELVYQALEPHAGGTLMIGHLVACYGSADRYLGMLAAVLGDWGRAEQHFEAALELDRRIDAPTWLAHTAYEYGRMLLARKKAENRGRAATLLREAAALTEQIGMPALSGRVAKLGLPVGRVELPDGLSPREVQILGLVARGLSNRQVGEQLLISEHTAANHVRSILRKTGCANRTEAASYAHRHGLVEV